MKNNPEQKAILIDLVHPRVSKEHATDRLEELEELVNTYGGIVVVKKWQKRFSPHPKTYIGTGKIEEIGTEGEELGIDLLIINDELKPRQVFEIGESLLKHKIKVWDRIDLILKIFDKHASTAEAKLEIELASIKHMGPRIFGMGMELSRQGGGVGTVGAGETNTEMMKRHLRKKERAIKQKIEKHQKQRGLQRAARKRQNLKTVAIVGYTNAGKTTLLNALTGSKEYVADELFATLDTRVGKLYLQEKKQDVLISDTIGFIKDLPPELLNAFSSTLSESVEADYLLHVTDADDENLFEHIDVVEDILERLKIGDTPRVLVLNKMDKVSEFKKGKIIEALEGKDIVFVSAAKRDGLEDLIKKIEENV